MEQFFHFISIFIFIILMLEKIQMKIIFLGTNGWFSTLTGNTSCILIDTENFYLILDAGDGFYKLDRYINRDKPIYLFLSHLHLDHIIGLHILNKFRFVEPLKIFGLKGTKVGLNTIIQHPFTAAISEVPYQIEVHELEEGSHEWPFNFTCKLLIHKDPTLGYRFEFDKNIITYCTDTGKCDNIHELAQDADVLISECSYKSGQVEWEWPHLNPEEAAEIAKVSNVKQLLLTHFDAEMYKTLEERKEAEISARKIFPNTIAAEDDFKLEF